MTQLAKRSYATQVSSVITTNYCRMTYIQIYKADYQGTESSNQFATHKISSDMISADLLVPRLHILPGLDIKSEHIKSGPACTHSGFVEIRSIYTS
ncbi:hypothetical protein QR685DRAFT_567718 [Neurospora intermedia]|uniref:Uncharacterized protein n=1 Tax=Neurospora intermedia TaxID=5142 RepID=A0ABR3DQ87_NEUIN